MSISVTPFNTGDRFQPFDFPLSRSLPEVYLYSVDSGRRGLYGRGTTGRST